MSLPPSKRLRTIMIRESIPSDLEKRPWADLPRELLLQIAERLGIIELLSFRGTCKDWHSTASYTASAQIESSPHRKPWLLLHEPEDPQCRLYSFPDRKKYSINIPEMEGSTCLASSHGWLLLFNKGSIFFFCPFSRAKIDLPNFPHPELSDHVATLSAPPTSEDCIVCIIHRPDQLKVGLYFLHRGAETWESIDHDCPRHSLDTVTGAAYHGGIFYFLDKNDKVLTHSLKKKKWVVYMIVDTRMPGTDYLPFSGVKNYLRRISDVENLLGLGEDVSILTCGTLLAGVKYDTVMTNESVEALKKPETRNLKGIWIQPRFLEIPPNQSWSL